MIAATATPEEKRKWLDRPLDWAMNVAMLGMLWGISGLVADDIGNIVARYLSVASFVVVFALVWIGSRRMNFATSRVRQ